MRDYTYSEKDLDTNLNELAHETLRELYLAAKKVFIYSSGHPLARKAIEHPLILTEKIFRYKKYFNLHIASGRLYALNIRTRESIFTNQVLDYMQILDTTDILFEAGMIADELAIFLDRFVRKLPSTNSRNLMTAHLEKNGINTIHIDSDAGCRLFESGKRFRGDLTDDFSVRNIVGQIIGDDFEKLAELVAEENASLENYLERYNLDYYPALVNYLVPEKISSAVAESLIDLLADKILDVVTGKSSVGEIEPAEVEKLKILTTSLNYHPEREEIIRRIGGKIAESEIARMLYSSLLPETSVIKIQSSEEIDYFLNTTFNKAVPDPGQEDFVDLFSRLLRTGQQGKARSVVNILLGYLAGLDLDLRGKALVLCRYVLDSCRVTTGASIVEHLISKVDEYIYEGNETFEFSDLVWELAQITLAEGNYQLLSKLCDTLQRKRSYYGGIWSYESVVVKKSVEDLNRRRVITRLIQELITGQHKNVPYIKNIFTTIGSEDAALALSTIISHESRRVRQYVLKTLSGMGKSSLNVFTRVMKDNTYFERGPNQRELSDGKWYIVRNSIFVLGSLKDPEACPALGVRVTDEDIRVRRAIVEALEKIGGQEAADLLMVMADDPESEIREAAIIALGFVGKADNVPELLDLAYRHPENILRVISTLGRLGGQETKDFLSGILAERQKQSGFTSHCSRDALRLAVIKALGRIGDKDSLSKIQEFQDSLSGTQKILFGGYRLNKAAEDILGRRND
jgi:HEAT repeat protein